MTTRQHGFEPRVLFCGCALAAALGSLFAPQPALAHYCSNIWDAPARVVVKPEVSTIQVGSTPIKLRVYVQNNFPYRLFSMQMQGSATGYTVTASPTSQHVQPGQNASFLLTISGSSGSVPVSTLNLQIKFRPGGYPSSWLSGSNAIIDQSPSQSALVQHSKYGTFQYASLTAGTLAERFPTATVQALSMTAIEQLISWFGYRFCYNSSGSYRCSSQKCPSPCAEGSSWSSLDQFPQNCMRAGVELAALHARGKLGSHANAARAGVANAVKSGSSDHMCLAAVVGAYLWQGQGSTSTFSSAVSASSMPSACKSAASSILAGSASSSCSSGSYYERAACAAAAGLTGTDSLVKSVLMPNAGDGLQPQGGGNDSLYYAYMLYIVSAHRRAKSGYVSYYPDAGNPTTDGVQLPDVLGPPADGYTPPEGGPSKIDSGGGGGDGDDEGCSCVLGPRGREAGPLALSLVLALLVLAARRRRQVP